AEKVVDEDYATAQQLRNLRASRRLLLQVEAVHATSWLWGGHAGCPAAPCKTRAQTESTNGKPLKSRLPIMWRRSARRGATLPGSQRRLDKENHCRSRQRESGGYPGCVDSQWSGV
ncbi:unnamed protein product, partial [Ectocarpus sp. 12 AP-2014]